MTAAPPSPGASPGASTERPSIVVSAAVVFSDGCVLLTRRPAGAHLAGMWEFPGGKVEPGEHPEDAVVRECREECGIDLHVAGIFEVAFHRYEKKDVLLLFYECVMRGGEVEHREIADHAWVPFAEIENYALPPADVGVVRKIVAREVGR